MRHIGDESDEDKLYASDNDGSVNLAEAVKLVNIQTRLTEDMLKKSELNNFTCMDRYRNSYCFIRKAFLEDVMAAFDSLTHESCFFKFADNFFSSDAWKAGHEIATSTDSRMSLRYSLKAFLIPIVFIYPHTASLRFPIASSGSSPWDIMSNSGQYTVYPPLRESGINSAETCRRCIMPPPAKKYNIGREGSQAVQLDTSDNVVGAG